MLFGADLWVLRTLFLVVRAQSKPVEVWWSGRNIEAQPHAYATANVTGEAAGLVLTDHQYMYTTVSWGCHDIPHIHQ